MCVKLDGRFERSTGEELVLPFVSYSPYIPPTTVACERCSIRQSLVPLQITELPRWKGGMQGSPSQDIVVAANHVPDLMTHGPRRLRRLLEVAQPMWYRRARYTPYLHHLHELVPRRAVSDINPKGRPLTEAPTRCQLCFPTLPIFVSTPSSAKRGMNHLSFARRDVGR